MKSNEINLMTKILNQLDRIEDKLKTIEETEDSIPKTDWLTEKEAQDLLNLKATSLWRLRTRGALAYTKSGNKTYYSYQSILDYLDMNKKSTF